MKCALHRDTAPNRSIALIKFRKAENALEFAEAYNGKKFNSMTVSTSLRSGRWCHLRFLTTSLARDLSCRSCHFCEH